MELTNSEIENLNRFLSTHSFHYGAYKCFPEIVLRNNGLNMEVLWQKQLLNHTNEREGIHNLVTWSTNGRKLWEIGNWYQYVEWENTVLKEAISHNLPINLVDYEVSIIDKIIESQRMTAENQHCLFTIQKIEIQNFIYTNKEYFLNRIVDFLIDNDFVKIRTLVEYEIIEKGKKLCRCGSVKNYYKKQDNIERQILEFLFDKLDYVRNRDLQTYLDLDEKEAKKTLLLLKARNYIAFMELHDGADLLNGIDSIIMEAGIVYLDALNNPHRQTPNFQMINNSDNRIVNIGDGNNFVQDSPNSNAGSASAKPEKKSFLSSLTDRINILNTFITMIIAISGFFGFKEYRDFKKKQASKELHQTVKQTDKK